MDKILCRHKGQSSSYCWSGGQSTSLSSLSLGIPKEFGKSGQGHLSMVSPCVLASPYPSSWVSWSCRYGLPPASSCNQRWGQMTSRSPWLSTTGESRESSGASRALASAVSLLSLHPWQVPGCTLHSERARGSGSELGPNCQETDCLEPNLGSTPYELCDLTEHL